MSEESTPQQGQDYATLARDFERVKSELAKVTAEKEKMAELLIHVRDKEQAENEQKKAELVDELFYEGKGQFTKEQLAAKSIESLKDIRMGMMATKDKTFASVATEIDEQRKRAQKPQLTVGEWDPVTKQYKGGI